MAIVRVFRYKIDQVCKVKFELKKLILRGRRIVFHINAQEYIIIFKIEHFLCNQKLIMENINYLQKLIAYIT